MDQETGAILRPATVDDASTVADVWWQSRQAAIPAIPPPVHTEPEVREWLRGVLLPSCDVFVAEDTGRVIGMMALAGGWIDQLYLAPRHTSRGVGSALVTLAKGLRPDGLDLWTFRSNAGARRFYVRHGFVAVDATNGDNEEGAPDVRYAWRGVTPG